MVPSREMYCVVASVHYHPYRIWRLLRGGPLGKPLGDSLTVIIDMGRSILKGRAHSLGTAPGLCKVGEVN